MIGRQKEIEILKSAMNSDKPELIAVIGRRRVGKTFLVRNFFKEQIDFEVVGLKDGKRKEQLLNFNFSLQDAFKEAELTAPPENWLLAFRSLKLWLDKTKEKGRKQVVFIDELPWIATSRSDFFTGFSYFWNSYASNQDIIVVICGSATAWMIRKIINNRGGLHNRVTRRLFLRPFTLSETKAYFTSRRIRFDHYQLVLLYMTMGGIPHYLDQVEAGKTAAQNINEICFSFQGILRTEFDNLYSSLFKNPERYEAVVEILSTTWKGLTRSEILERLKIKDGGGLTTVLKELEQSGFLASYTPFNKKKKQTVYRLIDNYSLFYLKYIKGINTNEQINWQSISQTSTWKSWSGYAYENICLQHIDQIKYTLGISGIASKHYSFIIKKSEEQPGAQIDLLIDRNDNAISICEVKFNNDHYLLDKTEADNLRRRKSVFRSSSKTKKQLFIVLVTTFGLVANQYSDSLIDNVVTMDDLFRNKISSLF